MGLIPMLLGAVVIWQAVYAPLEDLNTPRWIPFIFGLMFFNAGIVVSALDSGFNAWREQVWFAYIMTLALLSIPLFFLILFNWVAFGPGEREFSISVSIPFVSADFERGNEILGRLFFGIPTFLVDLVVVYVVFGSIFEVIKNWVNAD